MPAFPKKTIRTKNSARVYYLRIVQPDLAHTAKNKNKIPQKTKIHCLIHLLLVILQRNTNLEKYELFETNR